jgi:SAM-dependent methyltransferase
MTRLLTPELLDALPAHDPEAAGSRQDLRKLNTVMGHVSIAFEALRGSFKEPSPRRIVELGAGDGTFLLKLAERFPDWRGSSVVLLDRQNVVSNVTLNRFEQLDWNVEVVEADVLKWLAYTNTGYDLVLTNLFLHHFSSNEIYQMLERIARLAPVFLALEPRRSLWSLTLSRMVGFIGCNRVTRHDAPASVRAGFTGKELSELWPNIQGWSVQEHAAGWFSHIFLARNYRTNNAEVAIAPSAALMRGESVMR